MPRCSSAQLLGIKSLRPTEEADRQWCRPAQKEEPDIVIPFGNYNTLQTTTQDGVSQDKEDDDTVYVSSQKFEEIQETNTPPASRQFELNIKQIDLDIPKVAQVEETFNIIGQYQNTYIIFEEDTELKIVDQHIACLLYTSPSPRD